MKKLVYVLGLAFLFACGGAKEKKQEEHGADHSTEKVEEKADDMAKELNSEEGNVQVRGEAPPATEGEEHSHEKHEEGHEGHDHEH